ncbi:MAG: pyruvate, phosphate dikinase, partial [Elusimicrobia bacterium]|nr:pyruvate, phosphate dikinase [Elusimicrobiota bacterium]
MKRVYHFVGKKAEGSAKMKNLLGGKGANLAEMARIGIPVPPGFTITTQTCLDFYKSGKKMPKGLMDEVWKNLKLVEKEMGLKFGDPEKPLLVSVRSGARVSMPGMMDTVLNLGLNDKTVEGLAKLSGNERFAWDCYRRFIQMFGDVVLKVRPSKEEHDPFEVIIEELKKKKGIKYDTELTIDDLKYLVGEFKKLVKEKTGKDFPLNPRKQLEEAIKAVFDSWNNERAIKYRQINGIPDDWGTAVNVQAMVFGNMGDDSATGVAFTRDPATGEKKFFGEYLKNAQGEDVVAGIRTPQPINKAGKKDPSQLSLEEEFPEVYKELVEIYQKLEKHYHDMQDIEFTIQKGRLFLLQTRNGKRTGFASVRIAYEMVKEKLITKEDAIKRIDPYGLTQFLAPIFDTDDIEKAKKEGRLLSKGLNASPGAATGQVVFFADDAKKYPQTLLVRIETSPEDIGGMAVARGILTARGGMTCIAAGTKVLLSDGFYAVEEVFEKFKKGEKLSILSFDDKKGRFVWKKIIAAGKRVSNVIKIIPSQTNRVKDDHLRVTPDHKFFTCKGRELVKKEIEKIIDSGEFVIIPEQIPGKFSSNKNDEKLAYLAGAIFTDGYVKLRRTKGNVTFIQKDDECKKEFVNTVKKYFKDIFDIEVSERERVSCGYINGRKIEGKAKDFISNKRKVAATFENIRQNMVKWILSLDEKSLFNFIAGVTDGDGTFAENRIQIFVSKRFLLEGLTVAFLRLGIVPQITVNR